MDKRENTIALSQEDFSQAGHRLVDEIAAFLGKMPEGPISRGESPREIAQILGEKSFPEQGTAAADLLAGVPNLLFEHSLFNGHPKFFGYITGSPAPIGMLGDMLAATINPNVGAEILSPMATAIEKQTIQWLAEFIGLPASYGGVLVSGGNMANFTAFLAARNAKAPAGFKEEGLAGNAAKMMVYCAKTTHTWIDKAATLFGHGSKAIRWIATDSANRMDIQALRSAVGQDLEAGLQPFMVVATAGDVSTGAVDDVAAIAAICKSHDLWLHIDGAYGIPAAIVPEMKGLFAGIEAADSLALDPHKWLYCPLEAGCTLVKNPQHLTDTYSSQPEYYNFSQEGESRAHNFFEYGLQNSRGFRALKVWLTLQQVGRQGYAKLIGEDIALAKYLYELAEKHPELEAVSHNLSIATLRYVPLEKKEESYLNELNKSLLDSLQAGGEVFLSNAVVHGKYSLRACVVNFRTSRKDMEEVVEIIVREGRKFLVKP